MAEKDDRRDDRLPVTAEVGSEGGSFADPTYQTPTSEGDLKKMPGRGGASASATQAVRSEDVDASESAAKGIVRYPTEPPPNEE